jgi:transposase
MNFVGIDLHKKTISICVMNQERQVLHRKRFYCSNSEQIVTFFENLRPFQAVAEATASYEWLFKLLEPLSDRMLLAHPKKLRVIAESTRKSDKLDAQVLAEFLALEMIPQSHRPTPRQREHRVLVRHRFYIRRRLSGTQTKIRRILSNYNADRPDLFSTEGQAYLRTLTVSKADRFVLDDLMEEWHQFRRRLKSIEMELLKFSQKASAKEAESRAVLDTIPGVGAITVDVVVSELGDVGRFRSQKKVSAFAGLSPGQRESAGRSKELGITKEGSRLLRWALVEAAWRLVRLSKRWKRIYEDLAARRGKKKAIVAVARRLLCVMVSMLQAGRPYCPAGV